MLKKICTILLLLNSLLLFSFVENKESAASSPVAQTAPKAHKPPILTTAAIIEVYDHDNFLGIVLIERGKAPFGKALPGGKVEYGETVEDAIRREMMEEVNLELENLQQFHVYSDPKRDFRHHSVEVTYLAKSHKRPIAGDDAAEAFIIPLDHIPWDKMAFDHGQILKDYLQYKNGNKTNTLLKS